MIKLKKFIAIIAFFYLGQNTFAHADVLPENSVPNYFSCPCPHLIAHRGASGNFPDSTLLAFEKALEFGTDILELDVHLSKDKKIIVSHDDNLLRLTGKNLEIKNARLKAIRKTDAGYNFKNATGEFPYRNHGLTVLTLKELYTAFPNARFNIEIKENDVRLAAALNKFIKKHALENQIVVASKYATTLEHFRSKNQSSIDTSAHLNNVVWAYIHWLFKMDMRDEPYIVLQLPYRYVNRSLIDYFHSQGKKVHVWTVNKPEDIKRMLELGVDGVMTDYPELAYPIFVELGLR